MSKNARIILLAVLGVILVIFIALNLSGAVGDRLAASDQEKVQNELMIDFVTLQTTIKAVNSPEIPNKQFVEAIDTLNQQVDVTKLRNPFRREIRKIKLPPTPKPQPVAKATKKTVEQPKPVVKPKKRIVRPRITINGIIWDQSNPYAILDGEIYGEGDYIKGYTIQTIVDSLIVFFNDDDVFTLNYEVE